MRSHCYNKNCFNHHPNCEDMKCPALMDKKFCTVKCRAVYWNEGENAQQVTDRGEAKNWIVRNWDVLKGEKIAEAMNTYFKKYVIDEKRKRDEFKREVQAIFK